MNNLKEQNNIRVHYEKELNIDFIAEEFFECCKLVAIPKPAIVNRRYVSNVELDIVSNKIASLVYSGLKIFLNEDEQLFENFINVYYETQSVIQSGVYGSETYLAGALKMYNSPHDNIQSIQTEWLLMIVIHEYLNSKNDRYVVEKFIGHFNHNILEGIYDFYRRLYSKFKGRLKLSTSTLDYLKKGKEKVKDHSEEEIEPTEEEIKKFEMKIEQLDLSVRLFNALKRSGIYTVSQILKLTEEDVMRSRSLGRKSFKELKEKLAEHDLEFEHLTNKDISFLISKKESEKENKNPKEKVKVKDYSEEEVKLTDEEITKFINDILDGKDGDSYVLAYSTPEQLKFESLGCPMNLKSQKEYDSWRKNLIWWATAYAYYGVWAYKLTEEGMKLIWPK